MLKIIRAVTAVAALAALTAGLFWWTRSSPYRGRLVAEAPAVNVTRSGESVSLKMLEVVELRVGDGVSTSREGAAKIGLEAGGSLRILGGTEIVLGAGSAEFELRAGAVRVRARAAPDRPMVVVVVGGRKYAVFAAEAELSTTRVTALRGPLDVVPPSGGRVRIEEGGSGPWPGP